MFIPTSSLPLPVFFCPYNSRIQDRHDEAKQAHDILDIKTDAAP